MKTLIRLFLVVLLLGITVNIYAQPRHDIEFVSNIPAGRNILIQPHLGRDRQFRGKIAIDFTINRKGDVIEAHANRRATTIRNHDYIARIEQAVMEAKFNKVRRGPVTQRGTLTYSF